MFGNRVKVKMLKLFLKFLVPATKPSDDRVFPFKYRGKTYDNCTKEGHNQLWCSKDAVYKGRWKNCKGLCEMKYLLLYGFSHHKRYFIMVIRNGKIFWKGSLGKSKQPYSLCDQPLGARTSLLL